MNAFPSAARRLAHLIWHRRVRASLERSDACSLFGLDLVITPGVLHPRHFASSRFLGRHLMKLELRGRRVADVGTGSGLLALLAARAGATVTAIDIDPTAVACAGENVRRNELASSVSVIASDVFESAPSEDRFDLVITNPPFYSRDPDGPSDQAFAAGVTNGFFARLAQSLPGRLERGGVLLMIHSSDADFEPIGRMLEAGGMSGRVVRQRRGIFETLTIREFMVPGRRPYLA